MEAIFCIVLSYIVIRYWWKNDTDEPRDESRRNTVKARWDRKRRRKITTDEVITVILPTINNDGK